LTAPGRAEYEQSFQAGITALQSARYERAIEAFERCLEWRPRQFVCAYNIACGYSLLGDVDQSLHWLSKAGDLGMGYEIGRLAILQSDPDLVHMRTDPRSRDIFDRIRGQAEAARLFAAEPAVYVPASAERPGARAPLLVVLHADGDTKHKLVRGPWRKVADGLGAVLLAPSGSVPMGGDPAAGMAWIRELDDFAERPWQVEQRIVEAIREVGDRMSIDRERVLLVGEGSGALVAFDLATRTPALFRGVLLRDGPVHPGSVRSRARAASALGLRVRFVFDQGEPQVWWREPAELAVQTQRLAAWLAAAGLEADVQILPETLRTRELSEGLRRWLRPLKNE
jgi:predicted esterase